jgi:hypothetical protein
VFVHHESVDSPVSFGQELDERLRTRKPNTNITMTNYYNVILQFNIMFERHRRQVIRTSRFSSQSLGNSDEGGYLQQDSSNVTSIQPYHT